MQRKAQYKGFDKKNNKYFEANYILPGVRIVDLGLFFEDEKVFVISDLHIGYEAALNANGIFIPLIQFRDLSRRLEHVLLSLPRLKKIVINGDLKHEFIHISEQEWRETLQLLDLLSQYCKEIILVKGNHDITLGPIAVKRNLFVVENFELGKTLIVHGDIAQGDIAQDDIVQGNIVPKVLAAKNMLNKFDTIIIGHEHPAVTIGAKPDRFKCFLRGKWKIFWTGLKKNRGGDQIS